MCAMRPSPKWVLAVDVYRKGDCYFRSPGRLYAEVAFEGLELSDGKLSRSVLRGLGAGNSPRLPGYQITYSYLNCTTTMLL